jgi:hypothetical protein
VTSQLTPDTESAPVAPGRQFTEPMREMVVLALLAGNAVFLFLGFAGLVFVLDGWAIGFGARSVAQFPVFVGPLSLGLPMLAVLLATHVTPVLSRYRLILMAAAIEYAVSAVFGLATFLGAFADDLPAVGATLEGLLYRGVWLGFLVLAALVLARLYVGLVPGPALVLGGSPVRRRTDLSGGRGTTYRASTSQAGPPGQEEGASSYDGPTVDTGWPVVPPPPRPEPLVVPDDATVRVPAETSADAPEDATMRVPAETSADVADEAPEDAPEDAPATGPGEGPASVPGDTGDATVRVQAPPPVDVEAEPEEATRLLRVHRPNTGPDVERS